jgi:hypothetical protein
MIGVLTSQDLGFSRSEFLIAEDTRLVQFAKALQLSNDIVGRGSRGLWLCSSFCRYWCLRLLRFQLLCYGLLRCRVNLSLLGRDLRFLRRGLLLRRLLHRVTDCARHYCRRTRNDGRARHCADETGASCS